MENSPKTVEDVLQASGQFEQRWTKHGIPDNQDTRFLLGFALGRLLRRGSRRSCVIHPEQLIVIAGDSAKLSESPDTSGIASDSDS